MPFPLLALLVPAAIGVVIKVLADNGPPEPRCDRCGKNPRFCTCSPDDHSDLCNAMSSSYPFNGTVTTFK